MKIIDNKQKAFQELKRISQRTTSGDNKKINSIVEDILQEVKIHWDIAIEKYTKKFDGFHPKPMQISSKHLKAAWEETDQHLKQSLEIAYQRIKKFHEKELPESFTIEGEYGESVKRKWMAVKNAGLYIHGGRAAYPSTVLMNAIPAKVAGVKEISMVSPGNTKGKINTTVLAAAYLSGVDKVFRIGGAQAIGCLLYTSDAADE